MNELNGMFVSATILHGPIDTVYGALDHEEATGEKVWNVMYHIHGLRDGTCAVTEEFRKRWPKISADLEFWWGLNPEQVEEEIKKRYPRIVKLLYPGLEKA